MIRWIPPLIVSEDQINEEIKMKVWRINTKTQKMEISDLLVRFVIDIDSV